MGQLICRLALLLLPLLLATSAAAFIHYNPSFIQANQPPPLQPQPQQQPQPQDIPLQQQQPSQQTTAAQQLDQLQQQQPPANNININIINNKNNNIDNQPLRLNSQRSIADGQTLPHPIFRFQGYPLNSTSIKLIWNLNVSAPNPPELFDIDYGPIPDATNLVSITKLNKTTRDYTINQLTPDTPYQFMLRSSNREQEFEPKLFVLRTPPTSANGVKQVNVENPAIMPLGVKAEAKSNNSIQLSWTEPQKPDNLYNSLRVNIIRYFVNPSQYGTLSNAATSASSPSRAVANESATAAATGPVYHYLNVTNPRESRLIVQKLKPATEYAFAVRTAYWSPDMKKLFSQSGFSMDTVAKTYDLEPSAPRNFSLRVKPIEAKKPGGGGDMMDPSSMKSKTADITLEATWLPPESPNGQLKGYLILYANDLDPDNWMLINITDPKIDSWHVTGVAPGVTYYFKMRAVNQRGQSQDSDARRYTAPMAQGQLNPPIPPNNLLLLIIICMVAILFVLFLIVSRLACRTRSSSSRKHRKGSLNTAAAASNQGQKSNGGGTLQSGVPKLNGFASTNSASTVTARVGTLARRRTNNPASNDGKQDFWISADQNPDLKSNISEKSNSELNMAMVSIQRDSPQFATTQLAPALPDYRQFAGGGDLIQQQQQSHYHPGLQFTNQALGYDQMDNATASALMTLSKRQQQQMQKYQIQFAATGVNGPPSSMTMGPPGQQQAPSPHQQPPPPPPLNIEQQHQQQHHHHQHHQSLYGTHQPGTRSLRLHQRTLYDPVSGSFLQSQDTGGPPNYSSHMHPASSMLQGNHTLAASHASQFGNNNTSSNTLQFHPHQSNTLLSRRSTNTLRSFQTSQGSALYGQLAGAATTGFAPPPPPNSMNNGGGGGGNIQQPQQLLQSHQAVINQLNNSTYPSLPLKHVSAVRPQIMSSLEDQIEMELAEKEPTIGQSQQSQDSQQQQQQKLQ